MALLSCLATHGSDVWKGKQEEVLGMCSNRGFHSTDLFRGASEALRQRSFCSTDPVLEEREKKDLGGTWFLSASGC